MVQYVTLISKQKKKSECNGKMNIRLQWKTKTEVVRTSTICLVWKAEQCFWFLGVVLFAQAHNETGFSASGWKTTTLSLAVHAIRFSQFFIMSKRFCLIQLHNCATNIQRHQTITHILVCLLICPWHNAVITEVRVSRSALGYPAAQNNITC